MALGLLVGTALVVGGSVEAWFSYREQRAALAALQSEQATGAAALIEQFVDEIERQIDWSVRLSDTGDAAIEQRRIEYLRLLRQEPAVADVNWIDGDGREQLRISRLAMDAVGAGIDLSTEPAFIAAQRDGIWRGPVYFRDGTEPHMTIALADPGNGSGVTVVDVNLKFAWDVISQIDVGSRGSAYAVDAGGRLVAHPDISLVLRKTDLSGLPQVREAIEGSAVAGVVALGPTGREVSTASARIASLGWTVFVELPTEEALAPLYGSLLRTGVVVVIGVVLAVGIGLVLARRLTIPIRTLQSTVARIAAGDLRQRVALATGDELEELAGDVNIMAGELAQSYADLERKVQERTLELRDALKTLSAQRAELAEWNAELGRRVEKQVAEIGRINRLRRFLAPELADMIVAEGGEAVLHSQRAEITVMFCDLRGFTAFAETASSEQVMAVLSAYHEMAGPLIRSHQGTLERFLGDGLMVLFNAPLPCQDPSVRAVELALALHHAFGPALAKVGDDLPVGLGIGIAHGVATVGSIGFAERLDYAAIGRVSNLAARLCAEAPHGGILVDEKVQCAVGHLGLSHELRPMRLKGIADPVRAFAIG